jgi:hypothetical protein
VTVAAGDFSSERAWEHLRALVEIGPRVSGSEGAAKAREYIQGELQKLGIETVTQVARFERGEGQEPIVIENVGGTIPGESSDVIALVAPYDSRPFDEFAFVGANDGASGAAVLLELARAISTRPLPYTTWLMFFDGESQLVSPPHHSRKGLLGSTIAAGQLERSGDYRRVRLLVALNRVCDADLRISRDLRSNRTYREEFWQAAESLGLEAAFPAGGFESLGGSHIPFVENRLLRVVALSDSSFGGDEPPGIYADTADDTLEHCAAESLGAVGSVTLEALAVLAPRLARLDELGGAPSGEARPLFAEPEPEPEAGAAEGETAQAEAAEGEAVQAVESETAPESAPSPAEAPAPAPAEERAGAPTEAPAPPPAEDLAAPPAQAPAPSPDEAPAPPPPADSP